MTVCFVFGHIIKCVCVYMLPCYRSLQFVFPFARMSYEIDASCVYILRFRFYALSVAFLNKWNFKSDWIGTLWLSRNWKCRITVKSEVEVGGTRQVWAA